MRAAELAPVIAKPEVLPESVGEIRPSIPALSGDPLAGLDVIEAGPAQDEPTATAEPPRGSAPAAPAAGVAPSDWLSPEGALRGDFGELVEEMPQRSNARAPVFPTPPAPWPAPGAAAPSSEMTPDAALADLDVGFEDVLGTSVPRVANGSLGAERTSSEAEEGGWSPQVSDRATPVEAAAIPGALDTTAAESELWADSYGREADAIHGAPEPEAADLPEVAPSPEADAPQATDPASYLASEWPDRPAMDPSTLPTPVMPGPAVHPGWNPDAAAIAPPPRRQTDPLFDAVPSQEEDAFGWGKTPQEAPAVVTGQGEEWGFAAADAGGDLGRPMVTSSSLSAAEALERVAAQLRQGTLRADGFSPALGEAAALSAVLAALLGVDARWDVQR